MYRPCKSLVFVSPRSKNCSMAPSFGTDFAPKGPTPFCVILPSLFQAEDNQQPGNNNTRHRKTIYCMCDNDWKQFVWSPALFALRNVFMCFFEVLERKIRVLSHYRARVLWLTRSAKTILTCSKVVSRKELNGLKRLKNNSSFIAPDS